MSLFDDLLIPETLDSIRLRFAGYAATANLLFTNFITGAVGQQMVEFATTAVWTETGVISKLIRGFASLDTSTDPGDDDPYDPDQVTKTPAPGLLSELGRSQFGTTRNDATFATGTETFTNGGLAAVTFQPGTLTFTRNTVDPVSGLAPTYRNSGAPSIYTNPDGSVTVGAGGVLDLPISAEVVGTASNAAPGTVSLTTAPGSSCSATNAGAILGTDREGLDLYRARCKEARSRLSFSATSDAYRYFATQKLDGSPVLNASGAPANITRVYVSEDSTTGLVDVYYASPSGPASDEDVAAAVANTQIGIVAIGDCITFTGVKATAVPVTLAGSVEIKNGTGNLFGIDLQTAVKAAIVKYLGLYFASEDTAPIGGVDQTAGAGFMWTVDFAGAVGRAYPGAYKPAVSAPSGPSTAITLGGVPTLSTSTSSWTVTLK